MTVTDDDEEPGGNDKPISEYDQGALREIHAWKNPEIGWFGQAMKAINWPLDKAGDLLFATPGLGDAIQRAVQGLTGVCNDAAQWSVRKDDIYAEFRKAGHSSVREAADIASLDLEQVDRVVAWLDAKYKGMALVEGAGAGFAGLAGIPPDIVALIALALRAIGEYATYYGFDVSSQEERLFVMNVLGLASSPTDASKALAMAQLVRIAQDVAKKKTWKQLEGHAFVQVLQQLAKALGIRLTKAKLAQIIPAAGAAVGGGFNAYFLAKVCDAAFYLYRERFLAEKYGAAVIEVTVEPAQDVDPHYPEEGESLP
ncbi:MAG TPA: EcsC family protein [Pirellulales bacterium]|nr:EcsC family protein [Pirellulales bacterium]